MRSGRQCEMCAGETVFCVFVVQCSLVFERMVALFNPNPSAYTKQVVPFKIPLQGNGSNGSHSQDHKCTAALLIEHLSDSLKVPKCVIKSFKRYFLSI